MKSKELSLVTTIGKFKTSENLKQELIQKNNGLSIRRKSNKRKKRRKTSRATRKANNLNQR